MARRSELADVADDIGGPFIRKLWNSPKKSPMAAIGQAHRQQLGLSYTFDLMAATADPASRGLSVLAQSLRDDLSRHLQVRGITHDWVTSATLTVTFGETINGRRPLGPYKCFVAITDDLDKTHSSTRTSDMAEFREWTLSGILVGLFGFLFGAR